MDDSRALPDADEALAQGQSNPRQGSVVDAYMSPEPLVFYRPETGELLVVPADKAKAFEAECRLLDRLIHDLNQAKEEHLIATSALLESERAAGAPGRTIPQDPQILRQARQRVDQAEKNLVEAQEKVEAEFKPLGKLDGTSGKLYELIPVRKRKQANDSARTQPQRDGHTWGRKWTYVRSERVKSHYRGYQLNKEEQAQYQGSSRKSIITEEGKIDTAKLRKQIRNLETSVAWKKEVGTQGVFLQDLNAAIHDGLRQWADGINSGNQYAKLEADAQLLRYFAGAGIQTSWNPKKGNMAVRGDARAEFAIAEGKFKAAAYWPGHAGHMIQMTGPKSGTVYNAGLIRAGLELELFGLAGASACAQLGLEVDYSSLRKDKAGMRGRATRKPISSKGLNLSREIRDGAEVGGAVDLFAGARAGGSVKGVLEWNSPEAKKFEALCNIGPGGQVQAGAGISGQFKIDYVDGKFRVLATGSVCLGVGAGGKLEFEVDPGKTLEFIKYLAYMLYSVGYEFAEIITTAAFEAWMNFSLWAIQKGKEVVDAVEAFGDNVKVAFDDIIAMLEKEAERIALMEQVLGNPKALEYAPPETKGMILYQLTRHGKATKALSQNYDWNSFDTLGRRKRAVLAVCKKARSRAEFRNICQHMTFDGRKNSAGWKKSYEHLQRFLDYGIDTRDMDEQLRGYESSLASIYDRLYDQPVLGYAFIDNDSPVYLARAIRGDHDGFMIAGGYDPGNSTPVFGDATRYA